MAIIRGDWWTQPTRPVVKGIADVDTTDLADRAVKSGNASTEMLMRSVLLVLGNSVSSGGGYTSSQYIAWRPLVPVTIERIQHIAVTARTPGSVTSSGDYLVVFGNNGTCIGGFAFTASSTVWAAGIRTAGTTITQASLAACTDVYIKDFHSTCSVPGIAGIQIDYWTTG